MLIADTITGVSILQSSQADHALRTSQMNGCQLSKIDTNNSVIAEGKYFSQACLLFVKKYPAHFKGPEYETWPKIDCSHGELLACIKPYLSAPQALT